MFNQVMYWLPFNLFDTNRESRENLDILLEERNCKAKNKQVRPFKSTLTCRSKNLQPITTTVKKKRKVAHRK